MGLKFSPNNTAGGALRFTTNQPGLLSSTYTVDWDNVTNVPTAVGNLSNPGDLTAISDTNLTLTVGGTPTDALLRDVSITAGWTGTLAAARLNSSVVQGVTNDTNITGSISAQNLTFSWAGTLAVARGGIGTGTASGTALDNISAFGSTGHLVRTGSGTYSFRTLTAPAAGITVTNGSGVSGNPTLVLADDLAALEALSGTSTIYYRSGTSAWTAVTFTAPITFSSGALSLAMGITPQVRLTLTTGVAVMISDVAAATTIYCTPCGGRHVPLWDSTLSKFVPTDIGGELSQGTTDATKSPAAVANNSNYDMFVWSDSGTLRCTRGPLWTSDTVRGTGAGTTELELLNGIYVNKVAITNGPGARLGTYVGTVRSNGTATIDMKFGTSASGGGMATFGVWNLYNQVLMRAKVQDSTASWTTNTGTARNVNASATNRVQFVSGLAMNSVSAFYKGLLTTAAVLSAQGKFGFGLDATAEDNIAFFATPTAAAWTAASNTPGSYLPQIGFHYIQAIELADGANTATFYGNTALQGLEVVILQ
jgi:hypothetical protein